MHPPHKAKSQRWLAWRSGLRNLKFKSATCAWLLIILGVTSASAQGLVAITDADWNETAVRRVLHLFAYGGAASDAQIQIWSNLAPSVAIQEILTFDPVNPLLSPIQDVSSLYAGSLAGLQTLLASASPDNLTCPGDRSRFDETNTRADGEIVLRNQGLQQTWIAAVRIRGQNPFRHNVGFWLANYHMAVSLHHVEPPLLRAHYDGALDALSAGRPFHEVLAVGATSAAVARQYNHRTNIYRNGAGVFRGNDDFAREFHQLFFRINGHLEDPTYHEEVTIEHTAWALTGMRIDKIPNAYGTTRVRDWRTAPLDFTDHVDATGRNLRNTALHHQGALEILHNTISGATAEEKLFDLATVTINHPESLANIPVDVVNFFADDNLDADKTAAVREAWGGVVGTPDDLLSFLRAYAISTAFHGANTFKYRTAFQRNMTIYNLNTVDNEETYGNAFSPRTVMLRQGADVFVPAHDVFGGQTSLNAANNPNLFKEAYNRAVDFPNNLAKTSDVCHDEAGVNLGTWRKDWARVIPSTGGVHTVGDVGLWLWKRFIGDGGRGYGTLEQANVAALLATGMDLGYAVDPASPDVAYSSAELATEPLLSLVSALENATLELDGLTNSIRQEANRHVGMAINFITMTPSMFATEGTELTQGPIVPEPIDPNAEPLELGGVIQTVDAGGLPKAMVVSGVTVWITAETVIQFEDSAGGSELTPGQSVSGNAVENVDGSVTAISLEIS